MPYDEVLMTKNTTSVCGASDWPPTPNREQDREAMGLLSLLSVLRTHASSVPQKLKGPEHGHRTRKGSSHTAVRQQGRVADPWAAIECLALRPSPPEAASEESLNPHGWTSHLLKVLGGRRGPEAVIEARAVTGVAGGGVRAVGTVPGVVAVGPGQLHGEGGEEVMQRPGNDDVVEEANVERDQDDCEAHT